MKPVDVHLVLHVLCLFEATMEFCECHMAEKPDFREQMALLEKAREVVNAQMPILPIVQHSSDCALYNAPAYLPQPCSCGALAIATHSQQPKEAV